MLAARDGTADVAEPHRAGLRAERRHAGRCPIRPTIDRGPLSLKRAVQTAIDWETVTPLAEIPRSSLPNRVKRGLRWWKLKRARDRPMRRSHAIARTTPATTESWLASRSRGECPAGAVLLHAPAVAFQAPGGGENQLVQTGRHLESLDVPVRLFSPWTDRLESARLLHLFGMSREGLELARLARTRGVPVVLSPICWYEPRALAALETRSGPEGRGPGGLVLATPHPPRPLLAARVAAPGRCSLAELAGRGGPVGAALRGRAGALPRRTQRRAPGVRHGLSRTVPRAMGAGSLRPLGRADRAAEEHAGPGPGDPTAGAAAGRHRRGGARVPGVCPEVPAGRRGLGGLAGTAGPPRPVLASAYAAARVFALPSWFETPGLAALEAALAGCSVVITPLRIDPGLLRRPGRVRPSRPPRGDSASLKTCWEDGPDPRLSPWVATHYLWPNVAQITAEVYDQVAR